MSTHMLAIATVCCWFSAAASAPEPLLYERFEDTPAGKVCGGVSFTPDVIGWGGLTVPNQRAAVFDGCPETGLDYGTARKVATEDFTVEAFVKLTAPPTYDAIAADWNEDGDQRAWAFVILPSRGLRFDVSPDGKFYSGNVLTTGPQVLRLNTWYHVAAVSQGTTSRIYVNGRELASGKRSQPGIFTTGKGHLKVGTAERYATEGPRPLHGCLDEVRITPRALAPAAFLHTKEPPPEVRPPGAPASFNMPFVATDKPAAEVWQKTARARLLELVAAQEPRRSASQLPLDVQVGASQDKDAYVLSRFSFQGNTKAGQRYPGLLAVPKGKGPFPAMLALHGHGGSAEAVFDPKSIYHGLADRFARGGYVVLAPSFPHRRYAAVTLWDLFRCVDILAARPEVDPQRMGVGGLSMGGEFTMWIAACDERLKAAVVSGWMCTTEGVFSVPNCECWQLPGFVELMDVCEVHLLIAPRPVLFESAEQDGCFPIRHTRAGFERIRAGYRVFGVEASAQQDTWPAGHEWHGVVAYPFVDKVLGGHSREP